MKKKLSLCLVLGMLLSLFAACGSESETTAATTPPETTEEAVTAEDSTEPVAEQTPLEPEEASFEETASEAEESEFIDTRVNYELPLFEDTETLSIWYPIRQGRATFPNKDSEQAKFWAAAQENLGVDIEWVECGQIEASEQFNLLIAGGDWTDLIYEGLCSRSGSAYNGGYDKAIDDDVYLDLADYVEEYCPNYYHWININQDAHNAAYTDTGSIGAFLTINVEAALQNIGLVVNADYLDATGLDIPTTMEEWDNVFAAMKSNGVTFPCVSNSDGSILQGYAENAMGATVDSVFLVDTESGELVYGPATEESRAYLELATDYYAKGYIDDSFISIVSNDSSPFTSGTLGTWEAMGQELATYQDTYGVRVYACPLIRGDGLEQGQTAVGDSASSYVSDLPGMAVTTACKDLEVALTFMDWFYSDDGALIANYGWEEGMTYEVLPDGTYQELPFMEKTDEATGCSNKGINTIIGDFGLVYPNISLELANEVQQEAAEGWTADPEFDGYIYKTLPSALALTADESNEVSSKFTDIETYTQTKILSWICGQETLDDAAWAAYLSDLDSMGIEVCKEAYTSAYERYGRK